MNLERYQKVARVLLKIESVFDLQMKIQAGKKSPELYALVDSGRRATELWKEEFPEGGEFGGRIRLDLSEADLSNRQFRGGTYQGWPFNNANLRYARLDGTGWFLIEMKHADLTGASLRNCNMFGLACEGSCFRGADLSGASIMLRIDERGAHVDFTDANFTGARISFPGQPLILTGANMDRCQVSIDASPDSRQKVVGAFLALLSEEQRSQIILEKPVISNQQATSTDRPQAASESQCFIATAVCGLDHVGEVVVLQEFRNTILRQTWLGRSFIRIYELISPPIARVILTSTLLRRIVRYMIVHPAALLARMALVARRRR